MIVVPGPFTARRRRASLDLDRRRASFGQSCVQRVLPHGNLGLQGRTTKSMQEARLLGHLEQRARKDIVLGGVYENVGLDRLGRPVAVSRSARAGRPVEILRHATVL